MVVVQVNSNFHTIGGKSVIRGSGKRYLEYRRKWEEWPKNFYAGDFPLHLDIEASCKCNLRCSFCATTYEPIGGTGFMSLELFKKIIDEGAEHGLCAIKFNSGARGEPLLNKYLPEMVKYAKDRGIMDVYFNTNATLLTCEIGRKLIEAGLDRISISFEGTEASIYEKHRVGSSYKVVLKNIKELMKLKKELKSQKPLLRLQTVALPEIKLGEYKDFWEKLADEVAFIDFKDYSHKRCDLIYDWACPYIWQRLMIRWDGGIAVCGFDYTNNHELGNVKVDSIRAAWKGPEMTRIRELHKKGLSHEIEICNGCSYRTTEILKLRESE